MLKNGENNLMCQLERTKPTVENVTPISLYQQTQPRMKGVALDQQNELPILYGGGRELLVGLIPPPGEPLERSCVEVADFFVLSTCMVVWINSQEIGLQIPYQNVVYHGTRLIEDESLHTGASVEIVLTIQRDATLDQLFPPGEGMAALGPEYPMSTVELVLRPQYGEFDRVYNDELEMLFTFGEFGLNRGDRMVSNCNAAITRCMDLYYVEDDSSEESEPVEDYCGGETQYTGVSDLRNAVYSNSGAADDLDVEGDSGALKDGVEAGMALEFYENVPLAVRRQLWDAESRGETKKFKS
ncbi:LAME_0E07228g1_1 [Lachancea meyersii CBS 8951]|uniref:Protein LOT5 n=1 Tax=Lachancea meyersii CBS 8951 TaxID=1266667 RepID=A0A1G4JIN6_9SACH|nr:LAME_0E07228g1_1 [Lachancea meyersii CBS 8951]